MSEARYLNVDCILRSEKSLSGLVESLKEDIFVLWNESFNNGSFIGFETSLIDTKGPEDDVVEFLRLFDTCSVLDDLSTCDEKVFEGSCT